MSFDLILKPSCDGCESTADLYGSNCKHMALCLACGKMMAKSKRPCFECGAVVTRLIRSKGKRKASSDETKASNGAPPKKELKPCVKEEAQPTTKSGLPQKSASSSAAPPSGPLTEEEIRNVLMQNAPVTTQELVSKFKSRLKTKDDKHDFAEILRKISKIQKTGGSSYIVLKEK